MFDRVVRHIREHGYRGEYSGVSYTYYDLDGYEYWAMGNTPYCPPFLINRRPLPNAVLGLLGRHLRRTGQSDLSLCTYSQDGATPAAVSSSSVILLPASTAATR